MTAECIITGVVLVADDGDVAYNGDLFQYGDFYIVNCNEASAHTPDEDLFNPKTKTKVVFAPTDAWTRKGVWVFPYLGVRHSLAALEYMGK